MAPAERGTTHETGHNKTRRAAVCGTRVHRSLP